MTSLPRGHILVPLLGLAFANGCIEIPEFEIPPPPNNLGAALDEEPENCSPGTFACACRPDASCNAGLECVEGSCETPDPTTGDGDGDPTTTGDGDGDPTTTGDGDGDPTTTGDGDGDPLPDCAFDEDCPYAHICNLGFCELQANLAFVTDQAYPPDFGGLAGADLLCNEAAQTAGLDGTFIALLGDAQTLLGQRIEGASGWVRTDFRNLANESFKLAFGELLYPLTYNEFGDDIGGVPVYTGGVEGTDNCDSWSSQDPQFTAALGYSADGSYGALDDAYVSCDSVQAHLYCVETDKVWEGQPPLPPSYRTAFVSVTFFGGSSGLTFMDAQCQQEAGVFGLADNDEVFKAWAADVGISPNSRFDLNGPPWVRVDGVMLAEVDGNNDGVPDLADPSQYLAPLTVSAEGWHTGGNVWTGSSGPGVPGDPSTTCGGWQSDIGAGSIGRAGRLDEQFGAATDDCMVVNPIYCLQE